MDRLHPNYEFALRFAQGKTLDYGCGSGEVVEAGLARGIDIYGVETFYEGGHGVRERVAPLLGDRVREIKNAVIPFPADTFDTVINNQVFEHVQDLDAVLCEIRRVLKPDARMLSMFPSREVIREGHCGVALAHRFCGRPIGYYWLLAFRLAGFGYHKSRKSPRKWASDFNHWLQSYCAYRPEKEIMESFRRAGFETRHIESDYVQFRLGWAMPAWLFKRLGFMVLQSRPTSGRNGARYSAL